MSDVRAQWIEALGEQLDIAHESGNFSMLDLATIAAEWAERLAVLTWEHSDAKCKLPWGEAAAAMREEEKP